MLRLLSIFNWVFAGLIGLVLSVFLIIGASQFDLVQLLPAVLICGVLAAPHIYLGYAIERGRGQMVQTIWAILSLLNFPFGTAYGAFALWVCWDSEKDTFEQVEETGELPPAAPPRRASRPRLERREEIEDEVTGPRASSRTPYELIQQLKKQGLKSADVQERLHLEGLSGEEIETLMTSTGFRFSRAKQKHLEEFG